jgi:hypothetical protein
MMCRRAPLPLSTLLLLALVASGAVSACSRGGGGEEEAGREGVYVDPEAWEGDVVTATRPLRAREGTEEDWQVLRTTVDMAWDQGWETLPMGESMVRIGLSFLGTPYVAGTLEVAGEEGVVVNLLELDCVTFVENVLAIARFIRLADPEILESESRMRETYRGILREIRYRGGRVDGYPSRLHYFSDWIQDNESRGLVREMTQELGGEMDPEAIDYMSQNPGAYRQLMDPFNLGAMREIEFWLSGLPRYKIHEDEILLRIGEIRNGDIIAITSAVAGLDVAHTGLAYWQGGELHLLHAPIVDDVVEVSALPMAVRIPRLDSQDGIRVVRPLAPA